mmetsp:Transcript_2043/g.13199  ORF Transcript_2043/g.13199 Transcript_2043/m.13199 type:complete len:83 (-) Transcript_2043:3712-3960(-)
MHAAHEARNVHLGGWTRTDKGKERCRTREIEIYMGKPKSSDMDVLTNTGEKVANDAPMIWCRGAQAVDASRTRVPLDKLCHD